MARDQAERLVFKALERPLERLKGLLGTMSDASPVALIPCRSIHTFGMRYRIDVAFVARDGVVLDVWRSVPPRRAIGHPRAWVALERPHRRGPWLRVGEELILRISEVDASPDARASRVARVLAGHRNMDC